MPMTGFELVSQTTALPIVPKTLPLVVGLLLLMTGWTSLYKIQKHVSIKSIRNNFDSPCCWLSFFNEDPFFQLTRVFVL